MFKKLLAFIKKGFLIESSYKLNFAFNVCGVLLSLASYFFIDRLFGQRMVAHLETFGVTYFSYVLLAMAFNSYVGTGMGSLSAQLQSEQIQGTLEAVLLTPTRISTMVCAMTLWNILFATFDIAIYLLLGSLVFKISFASVNILSALTVVLLTIISFNSLGIIAASSVMVLKRGNLVSWIISSIEGLISGVYFPITILPGWLQMLAQLLPITHAIKAIELAVYRGYSLAQLGTEIYTLLLFCIILLPLSLAGFTYAMGKVRRDGSLGQY